MKCIKCGRPAVALIRYQKMHGGGYFAMCRKHWQEATDTGDISEFDKQEPKKADKGADKND
jgi:ribosomal protein S14